MAPPPLLQLKDIALTFGGTPLLTGAELSVSTGERVSLVGRNGSGKSTLLKIAAKVVEPDHGSVFVQPGALVRYLPQEPDFAGFASTLAYVEAGLRPTDDHYIAASFARRAWPHRQGSPRASLRRRSASRLARARIGAVARYPAARRADQPSRSHHHRMAGARPRCAAHRAGDHQPRPALPLDAVALDGLARPRLHAPHRTRLCPFRGMARHAAGRGGARAAQARPQDRRRRALDALRRQRAAQAQHAPGRPVAGAARSAPHLSRHGGRCQHHRRFGGAIRRAGDRGERHRQELWRACHRQRLFNPHPARRPHRHCRAEWQRQDHADQHADRCVGAGYRKRAARLDAGHCHARSAPRQPRRQCHRQAGAHRRRRRHRLGQWRRQARRQLHEGLSVFGRTGPHAARQAVRAANAAG